MPKGKLIVIEGACDGIGKTTQYELLVNNLTKDNINVIKHHFPSYHTYYGSPVEHYLKGDFGNPNTLSPYFVNTLYAMDRVITWQKELKDKYDAGDYLVLDRYTTSSLIYQSALIKDLQAKKDFIKYIEDFEYQKLALPQPDLVIFLVAPYDLVTKMRQERTNNEGIKNDLHERNSDFMKKVYENSLFVADYLNWQQVICNDGDKMRSIPEIEKDIYKLVKKIK
jgi:dTMP kinase